MIATPLDAGSIACINATHPDQIVLRINTSEGLRCRAFRFAEIEAAFESLVGAEGVAHLKSVIANLRDAETGETVLFEPLPHGRRWVLTLSPGKPLHVEQRMRTDHQWNSA